MKYFLVYFIILEFGECKIVLRRLHGLPKKDRLMKISKEMRA